MADVINLRRVRKARLRSEAAATAAANRAAFGLSKAERAAAEAAAGLQSRHLDAHRLNETTPEPLSPRVPEE